MKLLPINAPETFHIVARWMAMKENSQWLDFGHGRRILTAQWLKIATQRDTELLRVFTADDDDAPIGVVGLTAIDRDFGTARIWVLAGDKSFRARGYATRAAARMLTLAFRDLGLRSVNTWIVDHNPSLRIVRRLNFRPIGRQRRCHVIDDQIRDRLWFDLLAEEHEERVDERHRVDRPTHRADLPR